MSTRRVALLAVVVVLAAGALVWMRVHAREKPRALAAAADAAPVVAPAASRDPSEDEHGARIRVEVLNATQRRGLARRATDVLRDAGFDVVDFGNAPTQLDSTIVLDRTGHATWARDAARVLGGARVRTEPDSSRYVDLSVLVGADWTPPPQPLRP
ncbi:MAG TPA: LytR C-terminal domain-containing protein [Gemmatimonadaceae bacterium]|nr:LytR C-terminal domain-containing protein [Gemmatimonadaceae bacterium]